MPKMCWVPVIQCIGGQSLFFLSVEEVALIQIVCACRQLVEVVDRQVVEHAADGGERCPASGMRYVSKRVSGGYAGQPSVEVVAAGPIECPGCGEVGVGALLKVHAPDPTVN